MTKKMGRPSLYTPELAKEICDTIATNGKGINVLCREISHWPNPDTIFTWLKDKSEFSELYAKAKRAQIDCFIDEIIEISDDKSEDMFMDDDGIEKINSVAVNRARLRIDTRKWLACKLVPRVYGDKYITNNESQNDELLNDCIDRKKVLDEQHKKAY